MRIMRSACSRTAHNYIKKISLVSLRSSGEQRLKDDDYIIQEAETTNRAELLFFASGGDVFKLRAHDIPDGKASQLGEFIPNLVGMTEKEDIIGMVLSGDYSGHLLFCFENGKCAKVPLKSYVTKSNRKKLTGGFAAQSPVVGMVFLKEDTDIMLKSTADKALTVNTEKIPVKTTRTSQGVNVMTLRKNAVVREMARAEECGIANFARYRSRNIPRRDL